MIHILRKLNLSKFSYRQCSCRKGETRKLSRKITLYTLIVSIQLSSVFFTNTLAATLYGVDAVTDQILVIDTATGTGTVVGGTGFAPSGVPYQPFDLTFDALGRLVGPDPIEKQLLLFDLTTGLALPFAPTRGGASGQLVAVVGLAYDPMTGKVFGTQDAHAFLHEVNPVTGVTTEIGLGMGFDPDSRIEGLAVSASGMLYGVDHVNDVLVTLDKGNGFGTVVGPLGFDDVRSLAFDPLGNLYGVDIATDQLLLINALTGQSSAIGPVGFDAIFGLAFEPMAIPLPPAFWLFGTALIGLVGLIKRRKKA